MPRLGPVDINGRKIKASCIHFLDNSHVPQGILFLLGQGVRPFLIIRQIVFQLIPSLAHDFIGKRAGPDAEERGVIGQGIKYLTVGNTPCHHNVGSRMGLGEHVLDFLTGPDIPFRTAVGFHLLLPLRL